MSGIIIKIPQLGETLYLKQSTYPSLDGSSTIQNLKNIINTNEHFELLAPFADFEDGINYTLKNEKTNTLITQDNATLSDLGLDVNGDQWPKIILRILKVGGRKRSTRRRRSKRRSRRKKRTKRRRSSRRRSKKIRTRRRRKTKRRRGGTLGKPARSYQFTGGSKYQEPVILKGGMSNVTVSLSKTTQMM